MPTKRLLKNITQGHLYKLGVRYTHRSKQEGIPHETVYSPGILVTYHCSSIGSHGQGHHSREASHNYPIRNGGYLFGVRIHSSSSRLISSNRCMRSTVTSQSCKTVSKNAKAVTVTTGNPVVVTKSVTRTTHPSTTETTQSTTVVTYTYTVTETSPAQSSGSSSPSSAGAAVSSARA